MPILKQQVDSSPNFVSLSVSWKISPLYFFSSNNIYFAQKEPTKMKIFETFFECSGQNLSNFFMSILKRQVDSSPSFVSLFSFMKGYSSVHFSSNSIYFAQKEPIKMKMFETFECLGQILLNSLCQFWNDKSIHLQILYPPSVSWKITPLYFFLAKTIHILLIRSPLKWKSLRLSSPQLKICKIPYANFETASRFLPKFCIPLQFHER